MFYIAQLSQRVLLWHPCHWSDLLTAPLSKPNTASSILSQNLAGQSCQDICSCCNRARILLPNLVASKVCDCANSAVHTAPYTRHLLVASLLTLANHMAKAHFHHGKQSKQGSTVAQELVVLHRSAQPTSFALASLPPVRFADRATVQTKHCKQHPLSKPCRSILPRHSCCNPDRILLSNLAASKVCDCANSACKRRLVASLLTLANHMAKPHFHQGKQSKQGSTVAQELVVLHRSAQPTSFALASLPLVRFADRATVQTKHCKQHPLSKPCRSILPRHLFLLQP